MAKPGNYVDSSTQTIIAGLAKHPAPVPPEFVTHSTTPPEDMIAQEHKMHATASMCEANLPPSLLLRRKNKPPLVARISMPDSSPDSNLDTETLPSPPPTKALLSPLPPANTLHAGHTPIFPRSLSPLNVKSPTGESSPVQDDSLTGPLALPSLPGDGADDRIELKVLDAELEKIAREQETGQQPSEPDSSPMQVGEQGEQGGRGESTDAHRRSSAEEVEPVDGVLLKKPKMNLGAPLGKA